jgi:formate-dependent nitrite reductase membrane component NrfD
VSPAQASSDQGRASRLWERGGRRRGGEQLMVPRATFSSYYGRPVVKRPVWEERDIAGYLFTGGVAAGSALLAAGADLTGRPSMRRSARLVSLGALGVSGVALVHDLGRPERFYNMLRVFKPTSPMSVGSWLLTAFGLPVAVAAGSEVPRLVPPVMRPLVAVLARPAGLAAAAVAPAIATYTAVLICDTAVPSWHEAYPEMPFVFAGSALVASAGMSLVTSPLVENAPAVRVAALGAALELAATHRMESRLGLVGEPYAEGKAGAKLRAAKALTVGGAVVAAVLGRRSRVAAVAAGTALAVASALTRFGIFEAGVASTEDPVYTVVPQRERLEQLESGERVSQPVTEERG